EQQVYSLALSGTIAVRSPDPPEASPPGLYLYLSDGWTYLPGSDLSSQVRSDSSFACVVYDMPSPGRSGREPASGERTLAVAQYGGNGLIVHPLAFDQREFARFT